MGGTLRHWGWLACLYAASAAWAFPPQQCRVLLKGLTDHLMVDGEYAPGIVVTPNGPKLPLVPAKVGRKLDLYKNRFINFSETDWYEPNAIYIGVSSHWKEGDFHFYLIAGDARMDGDGGGGATKVHQTTKGKAPFATDGVLFKISTDAETVKAVRASMAKLEGEKEPHCLAPVLKVLKENKIDVEVTDQDGSASAAGLSFNLLVGEVKKDGKELPIQLLGTDWEAIRYFIMRAEEIDYAAARKGLRPEPPPVPK